MEPESTMTPGAVGRTIVLQGAERCRTFGQYLILRQIAEDRNVHSEWAGRIPNQPNNVIGSPPSTPNAQQSSPPSPSQMALNSNSNSSSGVNTAFMASIAQLASNANINNNNPSSTPSQQQAGGSHGLGNNRQQHHHHHHQNNNNNLYGGGGGEENVVVLTVPEQSVAYLIGRNGAAIADIQNQTGAKVHIARSTGTSNSSGVPDGRKVTISGNASSVEAAQQLIRQKLQLSRGNSERTMSSFNAHNGGSGGERM